MLFPLLPILHRIRCVRLGHGFQDRLREEEIYELDCSEHSKELQFRADQQSARDEGDNAR